MGSTTGPHPSRTSLWFRTSLALCHCVANGALFEHRDGIAEKIDAIVDLSTRKLLDNFLKESLATGDHGLDESFPARSQKTRFSRPESGDSTISTSR